MRCAKHLHQQMTSQKDNGEVDLMIIYLRLIESYLIPTMLTSPPWGNGEVEKGEKWCRMGVKAKMGVNYVIWCRSVRNLDFQIMDLCGIN